MTDGVNQPRTIAGDGTFSVTGTYVSWTTTSPNYVPICKLPKKSGGKLYVIDAITGTRIFHSVSGRFTDFVINRNPTGDKGGDATTTCKSVDYNEVTALFPIANSTTTGGLLVSTLYSSYAITPDYTDTFFGEPKLPDSFLFPVPPVTKPVMCPKLERRNAMTTPPHIVTGKQIGRASCRERVCLYV